MGDALKRYAKVPRERRNAVRRNLRPGVPASVAKLEELGYDPITALVMTARTLQTEILYHESCRSGKVVNPSTGKPRYYNAEAHARVFEQAIKVGTALLPYKYGKVTGDAEETKDRTLSITLTDSSEPFVLSEDS